MKYIPNLITLLRIVLCIALIFISPVLGTVSFIVFCVAGFTDMIDGPLARRIPGAASKLGADLDSFADLFLIIVGVFIIMPAMNIWDFLWFAAIGILVIRVALASIIGLIRYKQVMFIHIWSSKLGSLLLFFSPILYFIIGGGIVINIFITFAVIWEVLVTIEEAIINLTLEKPNPDLKGIWEVKKNNNS